MSTDYEGVFHSGGVDFIESETSPGNYPEIRFCPKCKKQSARYDYNSAGNLAFVECVLCGYNAEQYAKELKGN